MAEKVEALYLDDCYLKEFNAEVRSVKDGKYIVLDKTAFYPSSGGQPNDTGKIIAPDGTEYSVVYAGKFEGVISHEVDKEGLEPNMQVKCFIDWDRRYRFMRYHTAAHILSRIIFLETGAVITGNQLGLDRSRIDFSLKEFDREKIKGFEAKFNDFVKEPRPVLISVVPREEALKLPNVITTKECLIPESVKEVRLVDISGFDTSACAGTHVKDVSEVGEIEVLKAENKGAERRRIYFRLKE